MNIKIKKFWKKIFFWKRKNNDILEENDLDSFFQSLFVNISSEKKIILDLVIKKNILSFLFYTDVRNLNYIFREGLRATDQIKLTKNEKYYVWGYHQKRDSINLDFDLSTRAHFWKWAADLKIDTKKFCVIGIDIEKLSKNTKKDWIFDRSYAMINIIEIIPFETIKWVLIRDKQYHENVKKIIANLDIDVIVYLGNNGIVRIG